MYIVDASALVEYLIGRPVHALSRALRSAPHALHVPHVCDVEVLHALRKHVIVFGFAPENARIALTDYASLPLIRHEQVTLLSRAFALRDNFTAYDATYVALAESLGGPIITRDEALARAIEEHTSVLVLVE